MEERVYGSKLREADRLFQLARESMDREENQKALSLLDQTLQYQTDHLEAYFSRALVREKLQDLPGALTDYQVVLLLDSTFKEAAFNRARLRYLMKQYQRAIDDFQLVLRLPKSDTRALYFKGTPLNTGGETVFEGISTTYNIEADIHHYIGLCQHALGNFYAAISAYDQAISQNPHDANYLVNRGLSRAALNQSSQAVDDFRRALAITPDHAIAEFNLTQELENSGALSLEAYDEIIERNPDFAYPYVNRALAKMQFGDLAGALRDYDAAIARDQMDPLIYLNRALAREKNQDLRAALADYNAALRLDPILEKGYRSRGRVLFALSQYHLALSDFTEAIRINDQDGAAYFNRALVHRQLGNEEEMCADLEQARIFGVINAAKALKAYCDNVNN